MYYPRPNFKGELRCGSCGKSFRLTRPDNFNVATLDYFSKVMKNDLFKLRAHF